MRITDPTTREDEEKCWSCLMYGRACRWEEGDGRCIPCRNAGWRCARRVASVSVEYFKEERKKRRAKESHSRKTARILRRSVPIEEKCTRCRKTKIACDGKQPCNNCGTRFRCIKQEDAGKIKCQSCKSKELACDLRRP